jgi:uncharacterized protein (DUF1778 family)
MNVRTLSGMAARRRRGETRSERFELRLTAGDRGAIERAARAEGLTASAWVRRMVKAAAAERVAMERGAREPSDEDVEAALTACSALTPEEGAHLDETLARIRDEWST